MWGRDKFNLEMLEATTKRAKIYWITVIGPAITTLLWCFVPSKSAQLWWKSPTLFFLTRSPCLKYTFGGQNVISVSFSAYAVSRWIQCTRSISTAIPLSLMNKRNSTMIICFSLLLSTGKDITHTTHVAWFSTITIYLLIILYMYIHICHGHRNTMRKVCARALQRIP